MASCWHLGREALSRAEGWNGYSVALVIPLKQNKKEKRPLPSATVQEKKLSPTSQQMDSDPWVL